MVIQDRQAIQRSKLCTELSFIALGAEVVAVEVVGEVLVEVVEEVDVIKEVYVSFAPS